jgi:hypothetical protein
MSAIDAYQVQSSSNYFTNMDTIIIELASTFGDADLHVLIDGESFGSFSHLKFD